MSAISSQINAGVNQSTLSNQLTQLGERVSWANENNSKNNTGILTVDPAFDRQQINDLIANISPDPVPGTIIRDVVV